MSNATKDTGGNSGKADEKAKRGVRDVPGAYRTEAEVHRRGGRPRKAKGNGDDAIEDRALTGHEIADNEDL